MHTHFFRLCTTASFEAGQCQGIRLTLLRYHQFSELICQSAVDEISGSLGGEYEDVLRSVAPRSLVDVASTSETSVRCYQTTRRKNPEDSHFQSLDCCNFISSYCRMT
jgi:hypothetical protein